MTQILSVDAIPALSNELHSSGKSIVVVGGCFDILHPGHQAFLERAKALGDHLVVLLESDQAVTKRKGAGRPVNAAKMRTQTLSHEPSVDTIIVLPFPFVDKDYAQLVSSLKPAIIATTKGDPFLEQKKRQAESIKAQVIEVIDRLPEYSTTALISEKL